MSPLWKPLEIERLTTAERPELIGQIWDTLPESGDELPRPGWHRLELERRLAAADADPAAGIPGDVV